MADPEIFNLGIPIYDHVDLMDVVAPCEMFYWMNQSWLEETSGAWQAQVSVAASTMAPLRTVAGLRLCPTTTFAACPKLDLLWVPGGSPAALKKMMNDPAFTAFLEAQSKAARFLTSVCEGALLLAHAGLLDGCQATTHWAFIPCLSRYPKIQVAPGYPRYVVNHSEADDRFTVTGGGISSGLDECLELIRLITDQVLGIGYGLTVAQQVQVNTQYLPSPPFWTTLPTPADCPLDAVPG